MEELGIRPTVSVVSMVGNVFQELGMVDKYKKLKRKYPPPKWEYRYIKGKRVRIRANQPNELDDTKMHQNESNHEINNVSNESDEEAARTSDELINL